MTTINFKPAKFPIKLKCAQSTTLGNILQKCPFLQDTKIRTIRGKQCIYAKYKAGRKHSSISVCYLRNLPAIFDFIT